MLVIGTKDVGNDELVEPLGNQVHVTYGGTQALDVANAFQLDVMLIDLIMPDVEGCDLATQLRRMPAFKKTKIVEITGLKDEKHRANRTLNGPDEEADQGPPQSVGGDVAPLSRKHDAYVVIESQGR